MRVACRSLPFRELSPPCFHGAGTLACSGRAWLAAAMSRDDEAAFVADVELVEALGSEMLVHFVVDASRVTAEGADALLDEGIGRAEDSGAAGEGIARLDPETSARVGDRITLSFNPLKCYFFNPADGTVLGQDHDS